MIKNSVNSYQEKKAGIFFIRKLYCFHADKDRKNVLRDIWTEEKVGMEREKMFTIKNTFLAYEPGMVSFRHCLYTY